MKKVSSARASMAMGMDATSSTTVKEMASGKDCSSLLKRGKRKMSYRCAFWESKAALRHALHEEAQHGAAQHDGDCDEKGHDAEQHLCEVGHLLHRLDHRRRLAEERLAARELDGRLHLPAGDGGPH